VKKVATFLFAGFLFASPLVAAADTLTDIQTQLRYVLARASALTANDAVQCFAVASASQVKVGEPFTFVWFSTGANNQTAHNGAKTDPYGVQTIALDKAGKWDYKMTFYDASGTAIPCSVTINVASAQ
jgi:hypothetical protein